MKRLSAAVLILVLLLSGCTAKNGTATNPGILSAFTAQDLDGNQRDASLLKEKKLTMVNIWGTFCSPCLRELPEIAAISRDYADRGFQLVGIVTDVDQVDGDFCKKAQSLVESTGVSFVNLIPSNSLQQSLLKFVTGVPTTIFVDETGAQVGRVYVGSKSREEWVAIINSLLEDVQ